MFLEIAQNSQEKTCARDPFLIMLQALLADKKCQIGFTSKKVCNHFAKFKQVKNLIVITLSKSKKLVVILLTLNKSKI